MTDRPSRLVPGWRQAYRWLSVQLSLLLALLATAEATWPDVAAALPDGWARWVGIAIVVARVIRQTPRPAEPS